IRAVDGPIDTWDEALVLPPGEKGEITVKGEVVTAGYYQLPQATAAAKITDSDGGIRHRMGDMGYFDESGRLWFCGRKNHRVVTATQTYYSVCSEAIFNAHPRVFRTALVGVGKGNDTMPVLWVQPKPGKMPQTADDAAQFIRELKEMAAPYPICSGIDTFLFRREFPVDIRHNAKIFREKLAVMAPAAIRRADRNRRKK
ncbi:MAG: AMP-binding protein, partial [Victivallales bacterium]|nr:AMP-binding protein [Victivallales bacterium]